MKKWSNCLSEAGKKGKDNSRRKGKGKGKLKAEHSNLLADHGEGEQRSEGRRWDLILVSGPWSAGTPGATRC